MTDTKPNRARRVMTHIKENADIYAPLTLFVASATVLTLIGVKIAREAKLYNAEIAEALAAAGDGSRLLIDAVTGDYVIAEPTN